MDTFMLSLESNEPLRPFYLQSVEEVSKECSEIDEKDIALIRASLLSGIMLLVLGTLTLGYSFSEKNSDVSFFLALCFYLFSLSFLMTGCGYTLNAWFRVKSRNEIVRNIPTEQKKSVCFHKFVRQIFCRSPECSNFQGMEMLNARISEVNQ